MSIQFKLSHALEEIQSKGPEIFKKRVLLCAFCKGSGVIGSGTCSVCSGKKKNRVSPPTIVCRRCAGWGSYPMNTQNSCTTCRGIGAISVTLPIENCSYCNGTGHLSSGLSCTTCGGKGVVRGSSKKEKRETSFLGSGPTIKIKKLGE